MRVSSFVVSPMCTGTSMPTLDFFFICFCPVIGAVCPQKLQACSSANSSPYPLQCLMVIGRLPCFAGGFIFIWFRFGFPPPGSNLVWMVYGSFGGCCPPLNLTAFGHSSCFLSPVSLSGGWKKKRYLYST